MCIIYVYMYIYIFIHIYIYKYAYMRVCGGWDGGGRLYTFSNFLKKSLKITPHGVFSHSHTPMHTQENFVISLICNFAS